nr:acetyltransferase [Deltaproteobacteria bacterium]
MANIVIFGAGAIAKLAHHYFSSDTNHEVAAFAVDKEYRNADSFLDLPLLEFEHVAHNFPPDKYKMFVALSYARMNSVRAQKYYQAKSLGYSFVTYVSSRCTFLSEHPVGENCFVLEDNTIQPFVRIGNNVTLWSGNHIGHDSVIGDHCFISSQVVVSGNVHIGSYSFLGVNAAIHNSVVIAPETLVGAGSVIQEDTIPKGVYVPPRTICLEKKSDEIDL